MTSIVVIPARAGSKGVPGKNMKLLGGKPLIWYTMQKALYIQERFGIKWMVSTDCPVTYAYSLLQGGMEATMRPASYSSGATSTAASIGFHIEHGDISRECEQIIILQPTTPFTTTREIEEALSLARQYEHHCSSHGLVSVRSVPHEFSAFWQYSACADHPNAISLTHSSSAGLIPSRQQIPKTFYRSGSMYISVPELLLRDKVLGDRPLALCVDDMGYNVNIDTMDDWEQASGYVRNFCFNLQR